MKKKLLPLLLTILTLCVPALFVYLLLNYTMVVLSVTAGFFVFLIGGIAFNLWQDYLESKEDE